MPNEPRTPEQKAAQRNAARAKRRTRPQRGALPVNPYDGLHAIACETMGLIRADVLAPRRLSKWERKGEHGIAFDPNAERQIHPRSVEYSHPSAA